MKVMFFITDCRSFNELCEGQFEFFRAQHPDDELVFLAGSNPKNEEIFKKRKVGRLVTLPLKRSPTPYDIIAIFQIFTIIRREIPDVIVCSTPKALVFGAICARLAGVKRRIGIFRGFRQENMHGIRQTIFNTFDTIAMRCLTEVIYISSSLKEVYDQELGQKEDALCITSSNGLPASKYAISPPSEDARSKLRVHYKLTETNFVCIIVGRISREKGIIEIDALLDQLSMDTDVRLLFVGAPDDPDGEEFVRNRADDPRVILAGEHRKLAGLYNIADVHLFLSHREGFGNVAIEAAANGLPTIAFNVTGVRDSVKAGVSGCLVPKGDVARVMEEIEVLQIARARMQNIFPSARDWAISNFRQQDVWRKYDDVIFHNNLNVGYPAGKPQLKER